MKKIKEVLNKAVEFVLKYQKLVYPLAALVLAAVVVVVVLNLQMKYDNSSNGNPATVTPVDGAMLTDNLNVPLVMNSDEKLHLLLEEYYEALSVGDSEKLLTLCDTIDESELYRYEEQSKYLSYVINEVYTQEGPTEGTYVAYVYCYVEFVEYPGLNFPAYKGFYIRTNDEDNLYIVNGEISETENAYIATVQDQADVIELNNKVNVEYNEVVLENQYILDYLVQLDEKVSTAVGERLAELNASILDGDGEDGNTGSDMEDIPLENQTLYATALTSVNVRKSDSAESERLGEVSQGQKLEVVEVQLNGWTKVIYEGQEAFIKSEYLSIIQSADGVATIGMMKALDNVNVRSEASTDATVLGALVSGDSYEIAAVENGWVTIKFDGILAYVSAEYCDCTIFE